MSPKLNAKAKLKNMKTKCPQTHVSLRIGHLTIVQVRQNFNTYQEQKLQHVKKKIKETSNFSFGGEIFKGNGAVCKREESGAKT